MAFNIKKWGGYGSGKLGDYVIYDGVYDKANSYARVTGVNGKVVTIDLENIISGDYETFTAGTEVLIHISASFTQDATKLGQYMVATIQLVERNTLTLDKDVTELITSSELAEYAVQLVTLTNFNDLTLCEDAILTPPPYSPFTFVGGIIILRCFGTLKFEGAHISLTDCGIPANRRNQLRPQHWQETSANGESDIARYSGAENYMTAERLLLNAGDGAAVIIAKKLVGDEHSRIGNPNTHGAAYCRGGANSVGVKPSNITSIGGSTILIAAETLQNFSPKMIAKYRDVERTEGKGLCRCLIASNTKLPNDEGLYSYSVISDDLRLMNEVGIKNFGDGSFGELTDARMCFNNYAKVVRITNGGYKIRYSDKTFNGLAPLRAGSLILAQVIQKSTKYTAEAGRIAVAKVLSDSGYSMELDFPVPDVDLNNYAMQIISIPQFANYTQDTDFTYTKKFNGELGGVCAIACSGTLNLTEGKLNVECKGGGVAYRKQGLQTIGNEQNFDALPIGEGHGSVFVLAKKLVLNANSRIGATYSGLGENQIAGFKGNGVIPSVNEASAGGFVGGGAASTSALEGALGGSGASGGCVGTELDYTKITGGYGSNGADGNGYEGGKQGAHLFIVADKIQNFTQAAISTGGEGGKGVEDGKNGASSRGGGGSILGSSGGAGGSAFIFTN